MKTRHRPLLTVLVTLLLLLTVASALPAQQSNVSTLTLDRIFNSEEFHGESFGPARWIEEGAAYTTVEPSATVKQAREIVRYETESGKRSVLVSAESLIPTGQSGALTIDDYAWSNDDRKLLVFTNSQQVWRQKTRGDYWVLDFSTKNLKKLGGVIGKSATLMFARFSPDGRRVGYVRENNLYVEDLLTGAIRQLTNNGSRTLINGTFDWVYEEELDLRDGWRWSPDSKAIAYWQLDSSGVGEFDLVDYTDSLYPKITPIRYPKVGTTNSAARVGVVSADGGATRWLQVPGDPRNNYIASMDWAGNSNEIVLQHLNRLQNVVQVMFASARTGSVRTLLTEKDDAWVDLRVSDLRWLDDGKSFTWISERDGWRHLYIVSRDGKEIRLITPGAFDIMSVDAVDESEGYFYYSASPDNPTQRYLYRARLDGQGQAERLTPLSSPGTHTYRISPHGGWAFHSYSTFSTPTVTDLLRLAHHAPIRILNANAKLQEKVKDLRRGPSEFFRVNIGEGVQLDGWMIKPPAFDPTKRYPVLFYVYGEPAGQTVVDRWQGDRYLWHVMLSQLGYVVISVDNRGTPAPRGRAWRKIVYRKIGTLASQEQAAAAREIMKWPFVDAARVGIWGWSGGGSMTLNQMFRHPDIYKVGMSIAPISDQRLYDTIYQERYMGLPEDNGDDYRQGSPITYVDGLQGKLLVIHGSGDDNCHYQSTEMLVNALIAANKQFTMMEYPNRRHDISQGPNTTRHLFALLTRFLTENLAAGAVDH
jgi:dipeptidyl-peptidase-4